MRLRAFREHLSTMVGFEVCTRRIVELPVLYSPLPQRLWLKDLKTASCPGSLKIFWYDIWSFWNAFISDLDFGGKFHCKISIRGGCYFWPGKYFNVQQAFHIESTPTKFSSGKYFFIDNGPNAGKLYLRNGFHDKTFFSCKKIDTWSVS